MTTISYVKLRDAIEAGLGGRRDKGAIEAEAWDILRYGGTAHSDMTQESKVAQFQRAVRKDTKQPIGEKKLAALFDLFRQREIGHFSSQKDLRRSIVNIDFDDYDFVQGQSELREIEILTRSGENLINKEQHAPVQIYVDVRVDEVKFFQNVPDGEPAPLSGRYIRISPPINGEGAAVLPVDEASGQVLLVTQFRHPQRQWLHEIPRGFSDPGESELETGIRELAEEAAAKPLVFRNLDGSTSVSFVKLRSLFTDTGKLTEAPAYFLALVRRSDMEEGLRRTHPLMENPLWVPLPLFYHAVFAGEVEFARGECTRVAGYAEHFDAATAVDREHPRLEIRDAFTVTAALLAAPLLERRFPALWAEVERRKVIWLSEVDEYASLS